MYRNNTDAAKSTGIQCPGLASASWLVESERSDGPEYLPSRPHPDSKAPLASPCAPPVGSRCVVVVMVFETSALAYCEGCRSRTFVTDFFRPETEALIPRPVRDNRRYTECEARQYEWRIQNEGCIKPQELAMDALSVRTSGPNQQKRHGNHKYSSVNTHRRLSR